MGREARLEDLAVIGMAMPGGIQTLRLLSSQCWSVSTSTCRSWICPNQLILGNVVEDAAEVDVPPVAGWRANGEGEDMCKPAWKFMHEGWRLQNANALRQMLSEVCHGMHLVENAL